MRPKALDLRYPSEKHGWWSREKNQNLKRISQHTL